MYEHNMYETCMHTVSLIMCGAVQKSQISLKNHTKRLFLQTDSGLLIFLFTYFFVFFVCSPIVLSLLALIARADLHSPVWRSVRCEKSPVMGCYLKEGLKPHVPIVSHP